MDELTGGPGEGRVGSQRRSWREPALLVLIATAAVAGYLSSIGGCRHGYARHQVSKEVKLIEDALRSHTGIGYWLYVEGADPGATRDQEHARHQAILSDFERLAHVEGISFADLAVEVDAGENQALARFRVDGESKGVRGSNGPEPSAPVGAELVFRRLSGRWRLVRSELFEQ